MFELKGRPEVQMRVGCPSPPVRNDNVTPRHLLIIYHYQWYDDISDVAVAVLVTLVQQW